MFNVPTFQFVSRKTHSLWIEDHRTDDPEMKKLLLIKNDNLIDNSMEMSQEQRHFSQFDEDNSIGSYEFEVSDANFTEYCEKVSLLKRAQDLCVSRKYHKELYTMLINFVERKETDHSDNLIIEIWETQCGYHLTRLSIQPIHQQTELNLHMKKTIIKKKEIII